MERKIDKPKVFISYAWGEEAYNEKVISFATDLKNDGVDVMLDRWSLKEGFDTVSFMEKSVTDPEITNVLILLDPIYTEKADNRNGGVGTETQILSPEVYKKIEQEKIIPIVFERDENGDICKPLYLESRLHFDLTKEESYDDEYKRLVRRLYGIDTIKEPELGKPPAWLETSSSITLKSRISVDFFKNCSDSEKKRIKLKEVYGKIGEDIESFEYDNGKSKIENYENILPIRNDFLFHLNSSEYVTGGYKIVIEELERCANQTPESPFDIYPLQSTLIQELFIYVVAFYLKHNNNDALRYILNKTYFIKKSGYNEEDDSYNSFYRPDKKLNIEMCERDDKKYYSGTAEFWINNLDINTCNKQEFVFADLFCYTSSYMIRNYKNNWKWFPITYVYCKTDFQSKMRDYSLKLKSKEYLEKAAYVMGYSSIEDFKIRFSEVENAFKKGEFKEYRYGDSFYEAESFWKWMSSKDLGTRN